MMLGLYAVQSITSMQSMLLLGGLGHAPQLKIACSETDFSGKFTRKSKTSTNTCITIAYNVCSYVSYPIFVSSGLTPKTVSLCQLFAFLAHGMAL